MATNPNLEQGQLDGISFDTTLSLLGATTKIDDESAPSIGDSVEIVITGRIGVIGQKIVADKPHPFVKCEVDTMACRVVSKLV